MMSSSWRLAASAISRRELAYHSRRPALFLRKALVTYPVTRVQLGAISQFSSSGSGGGGRRPPGNNRLSKGLGVLGTGGLLLVGKGKYLLGALKLGKLATLGSMLATVGTYSMFFGLPYAAGMVGLITVHEAGHMAVMLQRGIPFSPMLFIPFVGASIAMKRRPEDAWEDALVAFGGPVIGSIGALGCSLGGYATGSQLLFALADFGYMINLFNMLPIGMMGKTGSFRD
jgi:Zn-dependent protease